MPPSSSGRWTQAAAYSFPSPLSYRFHRRLRIGSYTRLEVHSQAVIRLSHGIAMTGGGFLLTNDDPVGAMRISKSPVDSGTAITGTTAVPMTSLPKATAGTCCTYAMRGLALRQMMLTQSESCRIGLT